MIKGKEESAQRGKQSCWMRNRSWSSGSRILQGKSQPQYVMRSGTLHIEYEQACCCVCHYRHWKLPKYPLVESWPNKRKLCIPQKYHVPFTRNLRAGFEFVLVSFCSPTSFSVKGHVPSGVPQGEECSCPAIIERHCMPGTILDTLQTVSHSFVLEDAVIHNVQVTRQAGTCLGPQTWNLNPGHFREEKQKGDTFLLIWSDLQDIVCISKGKKMGEGSSSIEYAPMI